MPGVDQGCWAAGTLGLCSECGTETGLSADCSACRPVAVHADDPEFRGFDDISELPQHRLQEIRR